jgi:hypothetical protein
MKRANPIAGATRFKDRVTKVFTCFGNFVSVAKWAAFCLVLSQTAFAVTTLSSFQAGTGGWHMGTLAVGNLDSDSALEIVVPYRDNNGQWFLDAFKWNGTHIAGFPYASGSQEMNTSPTLYDLGGDGKMEIIVMRGNSIVALRGNGSVVWSNAVTYQNYIPQSGYQVVTNGFYLTTDNQFHPTLPANAVFSSQFSSPIVADFDGNGVKQIATGWKIDPDPVGGQQDYNPFINDIFGFGEWGTVGESWSGGVVFFNAKTGGKDYVYHIHQLVESGLGIGRSQPTGSLQTYVLNDSDSIVCFDKSKPFGFYGNGQLHKMFGKNLRMESGYYQQSIDIYPCDVDGDGLDEVLSVTTQFNSLWQPHESLLDDDGALMWRKWKQPVTITNNNGWFNNACAIPVNPDHDNRIDVLSFTHSYEINFRTWNGVEFVDRPGWPKNFFPFIPTPPVVGDVDGDGQQEIVIGTYDPAANPSSGSLYIFALDGTLKQSLNVPGGLKHIPSLADVNADGSLDVVYRSLAGQIYVQNFGATDATNVSWATHRGNAQRDGNLRQSLFPPNTPIVTKKVGGYRKAYFEWAGQGTNIVTAYRLYRASDPSGPFGLVATIPNTETNFTDTGLTPGWQYIYELAAVVNGSEIHSAPFAVLSLLNGNLVANSGFEENDNSHWDKWDTGNIPWTNMIGSSNAFQGRKSMQIVLNNQTTTDGINQYVVYGTPRSYIPVTAGTLYSFGGFIQSSGLTALTTNWFEWTSSPTGDDHNARPTFPYPNYFTPQLAVGPTATPWTYLNRVFTMPAGFPNVEIRHRFQSSVPASGSLYIDNLFFRSLPALADPHWNTLLPFNSVWKFSSTIPVGAWYSTNFADATWALGTAKFGAGSGPTNIVTTLPTSRPSYYFRKTLTLIDPYFEELLLAAHCTDDFGGTTYPLRLWINGQEIVTSGINAVSSDGNDTKYFDLTLFQNHLAAGTNTIAVQLNNAWASTWDNISFDMSLLGIPSLANAIELGSVQRTSTNVLLQIFAPAGTSLRVESRDGISAPWQLVGNVVATSPVTTVADNGQNGRIAPAAATSRYYRVIGY